MKKEKKSYDSEDKDIEKNYELIKIIHGEANDIYREFHSEMEKKKEAHFRGLKLTPIEIERNRSLWFNRCQATARIEKSIEANEKKGNYLKQLDNEFNRIEVGNALHKIIINTIDNFESFSEFYGGCLRKVVQDCIHDHTNNVEKITSLLSVCVKCSYMKSFHFVYIKIDF